MEHFIKNISIQEKLILILFLLVSSHGKILIIDVLALSNISHDSLLVILTNAFHGIFHKNSPTTNGINIIGLC